MIMSKIESFAFFEKNSYNYVVNNNVPHNCIYKNIRNRVLTEELAWLLKCSFSIAYCRNC